MKKMFSKILILFWTAFIGIGALFGSISMLIDPTGGILHMEAMLPWFEKMPFSEILFQDYTFAGISLLIVNGLTNITAFILIIFQKRIGYVLGMIFGCTLMLWIGIQFWLFAPSVYMLDVVFMIFGFLQMVCGYLAFVRFTQTEFIKNLTIPSYEVTNEQEIVIYFSRTRYTKKLAYQKAVETKTKIFEIKTTENIKENLGFWWCGRYAMHKWGMPLENINLDLSQYKKVYLYTPVWVFAISSPMREFLKLYKDQLKNVDITIVHYMKGTLNFVFNEVEELLPNATLVKHSISSQLGKYQVAKDQ